MGSCRAQKRRWLADRGIGSGPFGQGGAACASRTAAGIGPGDSSRVAWVLSWLGRNGVRPGVPGWCWGCLYNQSVIEALKVITMNVRKTTGSGMKHAGAVLKSLILQAGRKLAAVMALLAAWLSTAAYAVNDI